MVLIQEHFRILGSLVNLIFGLYIIFFIYNRMSKLPYLYIKNLLRFSILFNLGLIILLISKYAGLNLLNYISPDLVSLLMKSLILCVAIVLYWMEYEIVQIVCGLMGKTLPKRFREWSIIIIICFVLYYFIEVSYINNIYPKIIISIFVLCIIIIDLIIQIIILGYGIMFQEKKKKYLSISFSLFFISRHMLPLVIYLVLRLSHNWEIHNTLEAVGAFIILLYYNLVPYLWFRFFLLSYADNLSSIMERNTDLDVFFEKYHITSREQEIIMLILDGKSNLEIKKTLFISLHTVKNHIYNIYNKLEINTRYDLILQITRLQKKK